MSATVLRTSIRYLKSGSTNKNIKIMAYLDKTRKKWLPHIFRLLPNISYTKGGKKSA